MSLTEAESPIDDYGRRVHGRDELIDTDGSIRPHWVNLAAAYGGLGTYELRRRRDEIARLLEQDGVTYNIAGEGGRPHRPWHVDPVPLVLPTDEWEYIERGMTQRAELLDLVLRDLYGARSLITSGIVPAAMIMSDPQFSRACDRVLLPGPKQLVVAAVDLARTSEGDWVALGDRTQAPSGAAYALENRRVVSRVFPTIFGNAQVQRLAPFARTLRAALQAAAPPAVDDPTIVVLSPGPFSETAFEHASIASLLGYPLVEGSDLEIRNGRVWLRTVSELMPVHVILRRVDAWFCDPLELRSDSTLGVPGLVDATRTGAVSVVNPLGSGLLENAGLATRLPALARHLLGTELALRPVPSWWCGDPSGGSHVLANLGTLVVRPLSRVGLDHSVDTTLSTSVELDELRRRIEARPDQWVGQERIEPSTAPSLANGSFAPRPTVLRTFAVASDDSYLVMHGGLARTARGDSAAPITNRAGAISKDTWVLGTEAEAETGFWLQGPDRLVPALREAPAARAAEHLFWLGRYAERAEALVRLIRTVNGRRDEFEGATAGPGPASLPVLLEALTHVTGTHPGFVGAQATGMRHDPTDELIALVVDEQRPGTVAHAVGHMYNAIDVLRDQLSVDTWLMVGSLQRELDRLAAETGERDEAMTNVLNALLQSLLSLAGVASESMVRNQAWHFMDAGRRLERALQTVALVGATLAVERSAAAESLVVESVLTAGESIITYRRRYRSRAQVSTLLDLLLVDADNPRSLRFQIDRLRTSLAVLHADLPARSDHAAAIVDELADLVGAADSVALAMPDALGNRVALAEFVAVVRNRLSLASDAVAADFFTRLLPQQSMVMPLERRR